MKLKEADIKRAIEDYLRYGMNQGKWWFTRLNSGIAYVKRGSKYYAIKLCDEGTADFVVIRKDIMLALAHHIAVFLQVVWLEVKSEKGRTSPAQHAFEIIVKAQGCYYFVVRSVEEVMNIIGGE